MDVGVHHGLTRRFTIVYGDVEASGMELVNQVRPDFGSQLPEGCLFVGVQIEETGDMPLGDDQGMTLAHASSIVAWSGGFKTGREKAIMEGDGGITEIRGCPIMVRFPFHRQEPDMNAEVELPKAFSVRDEHEFFPIQHLMERLNPKLMVKQVATGVHVDGGGTVFWGLVYLDGEPPSKKKVEFALREAGFDFAHNVLTQAAFVWTDHSG